MGIPAEILTSYTELFLAGCAISLIATPLVQYLAKKIGALDYPGPEKIHRKVTPRLGGIAVALGFLIPTLCRWPQLGAEKGVIVGGLISLAIGIVDDLHRLSAVIKLLVIFLVTIILARFGVILHLFPVWWLNLVFTMVWITGVISAVNALDHMDGLVPGIAVIASLAFSAVAVQIGSWTWGVLAVTLAGSALGFLRYNFHPATIFLGDSGSFFIGYTLAVLGVLGQWSTNPFKSAIIPIIILGLPLFDLAYVIVVRQINGLTKSIKEIITFNGKDHFTHRLLGLGFSKTDAVLFGYLVAACLSSGAVIMRNLSKGQAVFFLAQFLMTVAVVLILMEIRKKR